MGPKHHGEINGGVEATDIFEALYNVWKNNIYKKLVLKKGTVLRYSLSLSQVQLCTPE